MRRSDSDLLASMTNALDSAWAQVADRFAGAPPEIIGSAHNTIADGIVHSVSLGATDLRPLARGGLNALKQRYPERFKMLVGRAEE